MMRCLTYFPLVFVLLFSADALHAAGPKGNDRPTYQIYNKEGKAIAFEQLVKELDEAEIVFFGELHDNPVCHWLQLQVTKDLYASKKDKLVLGAEMFETDQQLIMNEYLSGMVKEKNFENEANLWSNYKTDYKPLLSFAKDNRLPFIATNVPRRYANVVFRKGTAALDSLSDGAKTLLAPLPITIDLELSCYKEMLAMGAGHGGDNLPKAQALKDATMAHFILQNLQPGQTFLHYNGAYHSNKYEGIVWYVKQQRPEAKVLTITTVLQEDIQKLDKDNKDQADFTIVIPEDMIRTY